MVTKMLFPGLKRDDDIVNVIAFLKQHSADIKLLESRARKPKDQKSQELC
jgi:hypothetical protein